MTGRLRGGIDVSPLALTRAGAARYIVNLLAALQRLDVLELRPFRFAHRGRAAKVARDAVWYPVVLPLAARRERLDVLHCPTIRAPLRSAVPLVVTVHDVAPLRHPEAFNVWTRRYSALALPRVARAAAAIVTASRFQRDEIVELLRVPAERVCVIPYGVGDPFTADGPAADGDYVLAVSTLEPRKNLPRLVEAFRRARLDGCELRVVGAPGWGDVRFDGGDGVRWLGEVSDEDLAALYRGARCAAYVSLYEGFGLPVLEAMACGTAVVVPRGAPYDEFADGASVAVDPRDPDAIAAGLAAAVDQQDVGPRGRERAATFTWERAARATVEVYREVAR